MQTSGDASSESSPSSGDTSDLTGASTTSDTTAPPTSTDSNGGSTSTTTATDTEPATTDPTATDPTDASSTDPTTDATTQADSESSTTGEPDNTETDTDTGEEPLDPPPCEENPEENNCAYEFLAGSWYLFCQDEVFWNEAQELCSTYCAQLVVIRSDEQNDALHARLLDPEYVPDTIPTPEEQGLQPDASRWIGAYLENDQLKWVDQQLNMYLHWATFEPDDSGDCVALAVVGKEDDDGYWFDRGCQGYPYQFICQYTE